MKPSVLPPSSAPACPLSVLLVDDHPLMRRGLRTLLEQEARFRVCAEADSAPVALDMVRKWEPALSIIDIGLRSTNGIELTKGIRAQSPKMPILVVSMYDEELYAERALRAGAMGYLMKHEAGEKILPALEHILGGEIYVSDRLKRRMLHRFVAAEDRPPAAATLDALSDRELEVLQLVGNGFGTREIAAQLKLSVKTIDSYREHLKLKLGLRSGTELARYAIEWTKRHAIL